ncbi:alanine racemase [bacterium]|nr:alanine racemase [bacterium]
MLQLKNLSEPSLLVDLQKVRGNIARMAEKCHKHKLIFQPHFKTHQSIQIGCLFKEAGVNAITVSSLAMAEYFAADNYSHIHLAMPPIASQAARLQQLARKTNLSVNISCTAHLQALKNTDGISVFIDLDPNYGRTGIDIANHNLIAALVDEVEQSTHDMAGFYVHNGTTYQQPGATKQLHQNALKAIVLLREKLSYNGPVYFGDTPGCSTAQSFEGISHLTAGNFVFYDLMQAQFGSCSEEDIAVCMACPIVEKHHEKQQIVIHGGAVHFSKEQLISPSQTAHFGQLVHLHNEGWSTLQPNCHLISLSQEHGIMQLSQSVFNSCQVGDFVGVLPVHSCLTAHSMGKYVSFDGESIRTMNL